MSSSITARLLSWLERPLSAAALITSIATIGLSALPLRAWESWWHVALGGVIARYDAVPTANHFTYGVEAQAPSLLPQWLGQLMMYQLDAVYGIEGVLTARNLLFMLALMIALRIASPTSSSRARWLLFTLSALGLSAAMFATPTMFAAPLFALSAWAVWRSGERSKRGWRALGFALPPLLTVLWANLDVAYALTALLTAYATARAVALGRPNRERVGWALSTLACLLAPLVNPRGVELLWHTLKIMSLYPMHPDAPLWRHLFDVATWWELSVTLSTLIALCWRAATIRRRHGAVVWPEVALTIALGFFALTHLRALAWLALSAPCLWGALSARRAGEQEAVAPDPARATRSPWRGLLPALALLLVAALSQPIFVWRAWFIAPLAGALDLRRAQPHQYVISEQVPVEAVALLARSSASPRVWADRKYEGYVHYKLLPTGARQVTFTDPRLELTPSEVSAVRELVGQDKDLWRGIFQGYGVNAALLDERENKALSEALSAHPDWQLVHRQGGSVYFVHAPSR